MEVDQKNLAQQLKAASERAASEPVNLVYNSMHSYGDEKRKLTVTFDAQNKLYTYRDGLGHVGQSPDSLETLTRRLQNQEEIRAINAPRSCSAKARCR